MFENCLVLWSRLAGFNFDSLRNDEEWTDNRTVCSDSSTGDKRDIYPPLIRIEINQSKEHI